MTEEARDSDSLKKLLNLWRSQPEIANNIAHWQTIPQRPADFYDIPVNLSPKIITGLKKKGIDKLFSHQLRAFEVAQKGQNFVAVTGTASGKTLCYTIPILQTLSFNPNARALLIYPTKALAQDQLSGLSDFEEVLDPKTGIFIYDGDTPSSMRPMIRNSARILLTNPDMLHISILPHHTLWADFFRNLQFIVIDEMHRYRGIFGSHLANVLRRQKRISNFYHSAPHYFLTSATIGNPQELAERLTGEPVELIDQDGSPRGDRHLVLYNPPIINPELGIRNSSASEAIRLTEDLYSYQVQTIIFTRTRRAVELTLRHLREIHPKEANQIQGYRSGYLARQRRNIERSLRNGQARIVVATNALELGIDIGNLDAALIVGYPGTIAATRQQAGRAGRRRGPALAIFVASSSPIDQYLMMHPEYLLETSPEQALIDPDNLLILFAHLKCTVFELSFKKGESFGKAPPELVNGLLGILAEERIVHFSNDKYYWTADQYPADNISLRTTSEKPVILQSEVDGRMQTVGEIDDASARWMVHPEAIYLHSGQEYEVEELDLEKHRAILSSVQTDYLTEAIQKIKIEKLSTLGGEEVRGGWKYFGELQVASKVTGYRRILWGSSEVLGENTLDLPPAFLRTIGYWFVINDETVDLLRDTRSWNNDPNHYGPNWNRQRNLARQRDRFTCQVCGAPEQADHPHHIHHIKPFRTFPDFIAANQLENLITLCSACHKRAEQSVRMRSGLAGLAYTLHHLAPLFLMCDISDIGLSYEPNSELADGKPAIILFDLVPAGVGLSEKIYRLHGQILSGALEVIEKCPCRDGCPGCVGPAGENGIGGKNETLALMREVRTI